MKSLVIGMCIGAIATCMWIIILPGQELRGKHQQLIIENYKLKSEIWGLKTNIDRLKSGKKMSGSDLILKMDKTSMNGETK